MKHQVAALAVLVVGFGSSVTVTASSARRLSRQQAKIQEAWDLLWDGNEEAILAKMGQTYPVDDHAKYKSHQHHHRRTAAVQTPQRQLQDCSTIEQVVQGECDLTQYCDFVVEDSFDDFEIECVS